MSGYRPPVRADLVDEKAYGAPQLDVPVCLNVNENPFPPSAELARDVASAVALAVAGANRYPDRDFLALRAALADYLADESGVRLGAENMWAANGSNEVMAHVMAAFGGPERTALTFPPTYSMYPEYARESFTELIEVARDSAFRVDIPSAVEAIEHYRPSIVLIASPNNPTGTATPIDALRSLASAVGDVDGVLVIDEAYAEFRHSGVPSALELLEEFPHVIVTRTMSKAFAMAGARIGFAAAHPAVVEALQVVRLPYHLSAITQAVATVALGYAAELQRDLDVLRGERDAMYSALLDRQLTVVPSDANFLLFGSFPDRHVVWQGLLDRGVLIRETGPAGWLRVSVGTPQENARFISALDEVLAPTADDSRMAVVDE